MESDERLDLPNLHKTLPSTNAHSRSVISILDSEDTEQADLRGGGSPWFKAIKNPPSLDVRQSAKCDALIVGGGITGSLLAERMTR